MQKFTLHSHTNSYGIFDGRNSIEEMIKAAEEKGLKEYGISNHMICYPDCLAYPMPMYFKNFEDSLDIYKKLVDDIRKAGARSSMKVYVGFEVDFFITPSWRKNFEKIIKQLDVDYLIGSTHNLFDKDFKKACTVYDVKDNIVPLLPQEKLQWSHNYWRSSIEMIKSGYFDFIAHFDLIKIAGIAEDEETKELKQEMVETLAKYRQPYEFNTSTYNKFSEASPSKELLIELNKRNVPVLISDDSHWVEAIGQHYDKAEALLAEIGYKNRWSIAGKHD